MCGNLNEKVVCCFCGESLNIKVAAVIVLKPNIDSEESQQLFCHKIHFVEKIDKRIVLHPDFFEDSKP
jgi:hypothetical protein